TIAAAPQQRDRSDDLEETQREIASSACQEALSHGVGEDAFLKLARTVYKTVSAQLNADIESLRERVTPAHEALIDKHADLILQRDKLKAMLTEASEWLDDGVGRSDEE
ncbi:hypothetical protein, partial [Pseudomonas viridiflava]|uniref:hypothetical protein n=1 Tax=Pseudomonas viridiflava TaxID=33069 RepID=UPI0013CF1413